MEKSCKQLIVTLVETICRLISKIEELIAAIDRMPTRVQGTLLDTEEVCEMMHIKRNTLYKLKKLHDIPSRRIGKKDFYRLEDIEKYVFLK